MTHGNIVEKLDCPVIGSFSSLVYRYIEPFKEIKGGIIHGWSDKHIAEIIVLRSDIALSACPAVPARHTDCILERRLQRLVIRIVILSEEPYFIFAQRRGEILKGYLSPCH